MDKINDELKKLELEIADVKRRTGTAETGFPIFPKAPVLWPKNWLSENIFPFC